MVPWIGNTIFIGGLSLMLGAAVVVSSKSQRENSARPVEVRWTPSLNQRACEPGSLLAVFQSRIVRFDHCPVAAASASLCGSYVKPFELVRISAKLTHATCLTPRSVNATIIASTSSANVEALSLYPSSTTTRSSPNVRSAAISTPLVPEHEDRFVHRLETALIVGEVKDPSITERNSEVLADAMLLPTESPMNPNLVGATISRTTRTVKPGDGRLRSLRKSHEFIRLLPDLPVKTRSSNQIPSYPWYWLAAALTIDAEASCPMPYSDSSVSASMTRVQRWFGLRSVSSPMSLTAGNAPPAVRGPFDAENSVETSWPAFGCPTGHRRTTLAVVATAASVRGSSRTAAFPLAAPRRAAPPYTWQAVVSQVVA